MKSLVIVLSLLTVAGMVPVLGRIGFVDRGAIADEGEPVSKPGDDSDAREFALAAKEEPGEQKDASVPAERKTSPSVATEVAKPGVVIDPDATVVTSYKTKKADAAKLAESLKAVLALDSPGLMSKLTLKPGANELLIGGTERAQKHVMAVLALAERLKGDDAIRTANVLVAAGKPRPFLLKHVNVTEVAVALRELLTVDPSRLLAVAADSEGKQLYLSGSDAMLDVLAVVLEKINQPIELPYRVDDQPGTSGFQSEWRSPEKLAKTVQKLFEPLVSRNVVKLHVDDKSHLLMVTGPAELRDRVGDVVKSLDQAYQAALADKPLDEKLSRVAEPDADAPTTTARKPSPKGVTIEPRLVRLKHMLAPQMAELLQTLYPEFDVRAIITGGGLDKRDLWIRADDEAYSILARRAYEIDENTKIAVEEAKKAEQPTSEPDRFEGALSDGDRAKLSQRFRDLDRQAVRLASECIVLRQTESSAPRLREFTTQLRSTVAEAFNARQRWQAAELAELRSRLERLERGIKTREQLKPQITEQRVQELLAGARLESNTYQSTDEATPRGAARTPEHTSGYAASSPQEEAAARVRQVLLQKLTDAEVELELERAQVQAQREEFEREVKGVSVSETVVEALLQENEDIADMERQIRELRTKLQIRNPESPVAVQEKKTLASLEQRLHERKKELRPQMQKVAEENALGFKRAAVTKAEAALKSKERIVELLRQKLAEETKSAVPPRSTRENQIRRAAIAWLSDPEAAKARAKELHRPVLAYIDRPAKSVEAEEQKNWMYDPAVVDVIEKSFVAVRIVDDETDDDEAAKKFPLVMVLSPEGKLHTEIAHFQYDERFLELLQKLAAEYDALRETDAARRPAPAQTANRPQGESGGEAATGHGDVPAQREYSLTYNSATPDPRQAVIEAERAVTKAKARGEVASRNEAVDLRELEEARQSGDARAIKFREESLAGKQRDRLLELEGLETAKRQLEFAKASLAAKVRTLELDLSAAELRLREARTEQLEAEKLFQKKAISEQDYRARDTAAKLAGVDFERAQVQLDLYRNSIPAGSGAGNNADGKSAEKPAGERKAEESSSSEPRAEGGISVRVDTPVDPRQALFIAEEKTVQAQRQLERAQKVQRESAANLERVRKLIQVDPVNGKATLLKAEQATQNAQREVDEAGDALRLSERQLESVRGILMTQIRLLELDRTSAETRLKDAQEDYANKKRLSEKGYVTEADLKGTLREAKRAELDLERVSIQLDAYAKALRSGPTETGKLPAKTKPAEAKSEQTPGEGKQETTPDAKKEDAKPESAPKAESATERKVDGEAQAGE